MVRFWWSAVVLAGLLTLLLLGTGSWLLYSPAGTRWVLNRLPVWTGTELSIGQIEGTLGGTLQLDDIELRHKEVQLHLGHFSMHNQLSSLLHLTLEIGQLRVEHLQIKSTAVQQKKSMEDFHWPKTPWLLDQLHADLSDVEIHNFSWQQQDQKPLKIELFRGNLLWQNSSLHAKELILKTADLQGSGSFSCGLNLPLLKLAAQVDARDSAAAWRQLQLQIDLKPGTAGQILHGSATLGITGPEGKLLAAAAELGLTAEQLQFQQLQLSRHNHPGEITANGSLLFNGNNPELISQLQFSKIDLQAETGQPVQLSGTVQIKGGLEAYSGQFDLKNHGTGLTDASLAGDFTGDFEQLTLNNLHGEWLNGILDGQAQIGWKKGWQLKTQLTGRGIDPQDIHPQLAGRLNLDFQADLNASPEEPLRGQLQFQLHDSTLQNQPLSGVAQIKLQDNSLQVEQLQLRGDGMLLQASGNPGKRLAINWQIERLQQLLADATGRFSGNGWLRWHNQKLSAELNADAEKLAFQEWQLGKLDLQAATDDATGPWQLQFIGRLLHNRQLGLDIEQIKIDIQGALDNHQLTLNLTQQPSSISASFRGGWIEQQWRGELSNFQGADARIGNWHLRQAVPVVLSANLLNVDLLSLRSDNDSELQLQGNYLPELQQGAAKLRWQNLDLSLLRPMLADWHISGVSHGTLELEHGQSNQIHGKITVAGELQRQQLNLKLSSSDILVDWDERGLRSSLQIILSNGGNLNGVLTSPQAADFSWPQQGDLQLTGRDFPLKMFHPWLPPELNISGTLGWNTIGSWQADEPLSLKGEAKTGAGRFYWQEEDSIISADISAAKLSWQWQNRLLGKLNLQLREQGSIEAAFGLPLAARLPLAFDQTAPVDANLNAHLQELGLLSIVFPGRVQESHGQLKLDLQLAGSWQQPNLLGNFHLFDAGIFLPTVGVQLNEIELEGNFAENRVEIAKLQLSSGKGRLDGSGQLELQNWFPAAYQLQLKGENFQLINLPELQVHANPELVIDGTGENVRIRGQVQFPDVLISGKQKTAQAVNSPDLLVVDRETPSTRQPKLQHDIDLQLVLGERVLLNTAGIDARLEGNLRLQSAAKQELVANGEIRVAKGKYSSYGVSLDISRGNLFFTGGPLDQPTLDILALRKAGEVQAGVKVTGTPKAPIVQLYSEPVMAEADILSYIVIGRPIGADSGQTDLLMTAASTLLSQGESVLLQEQLKSRLGLDVLDISSGDGDVNSSIITTGKYISPDLYISLGYSLFSNTNEVKVRYNLTPAWEVESSIGTESGIDMFYRIEIE
ncbi:MAG: translocation/assembly module TamB domain-containing protein [Desulfuromusa sp.]|jgi:translocation and assembly module TamB|nr:translocation/assembly module TamB domain-containing protein [Desulfuromusa sp.]